MMYQFDDDFLRGIEVLMKLGLTRLQSKVLAASMWGGGLTIMEMARALNIHRSEVYRALKSLVKLGLVEVAVENPPRYHGVEPERAVRLLLDARRTDLMTLESETDGLVSWLRDKGEANPSPPASREAMPDFRLIRGKAVTPRIVQYIKSARKEIVKVVSSNALRRHYVEFSEYEHEATMRGNTVRILTEIKPRDLLVAKDYSRYVHLNHVADLDNSLRYMVIDGTDLVLAGTINSGGKPDQMILVTRNLVMVKGCLSYFEELWSKSVPAHARIRVLSEKFGRDEVSTEAVGGEHHPHPSYMP